jgi:predicted RNA binding protein YcfA (HicA-like mRNA interferase family)
MGFTKDRQTGSHVVLKKPIGAEDGTRIGEVVCVVPLHRELKIGTLSGVLKQAQVTPEEFITNL